jgi:hypothetical protein
MQTMMLNDMNMFASTHMQMALTLFLMMSRTRIQQQPMQMTTKSQMISPTVKQGRRILQTSLQRNCQHNWQTSSRTKTNLFLPSPQAELLCWHYQSGHLPFTCLRILSLIGTIPKCLLRVKASKCAGCMYGAMTKRPWRTKGIQNKNKIRVATSPGDCISIDQLESLTPGFIAQLKGRLTKKRYGAATIFVNHASHLSYFQ